MRSLEQYRDLIAQAEGAACTHPLLYRVQLALLAALGIGYVVLLAVLATGCALFVIGLMLVSKSVLLVKLALLPMGAAYLLSRALWFHLPPPQGRRVTGTEVPALFAEIEQVRRQVRAKPVHEVLLTSDFNAAVVQIPRLGMLGWSKRHLVIGLPLLASLPPYQFRAVLAHEFGHLAQNHARFANWIYRIRELWSQILEAVEPRRNLLTGLLTRFFDWYAPYFNAYSFVLARANEYEADRESANVTSPEDAGDALAAVYSKSEYIESRFWAEFYARAEAQAQPPSQPFSDYVAALRGVPAEHSAAALAAALARDTGLNDTHPSLKDRLRSLGVRPNLPLCFQLSAAHALLRDKRLQLMHEFNEVWRELIAGPWKERHEFLTQTAEKLSQFETARQQRGLSEDEHWEYACAIETLRGGRAALPVLDALLERSPSHAPAYYARGRILLEGNEERGVADVERAMQLDEAAREAGSQLLYTYFYSRNQLVRCSRYRDILSQVAYERELAEAERKVLGRRDTLEPHELSESQLHEWRTVLARQTRLKRAWLVRKRVQHLQSVPAYVLVLEFSALAWVTRSMLRSVVEELSAQASCLVLHKSTNRAASRRVRKVAGSFIFPVEPGARDELR
ncbi:MAG TPA: M48 family metalloprotease [Burkholderiales bacterium]|nr:M48 family metalloprotease [Burkholderiales bacterium]